MNIASLLDRAQQLLATAVSVQNQAASYLHKLPGFSFDDYLERQTHMRTELHEWIERVFVEFRELELRLLLRDLKTSLILR